jgi:hypothetical protein
VNPIFENENDRIRQEFARQKVEEYLRGHGKQVNCCETPEEDRESHDFNVYHQEGGLVGVGETKCRAHGYTEKFFRCNPVLVERERASKLYWKFHVFGLEVLLVLMTSDWKVYMITLRRLLAGEGDWPEAQAGMLKDNHGQQGCDKSGVLVPLKHYTKVGEKNE